MPNAPSRLIGATMFSQKAGSLPVVIYHYINNSPAGLTVSPSLFERHCRVLAEEGWRGIGLDEAEAFFLHGEKIPPKSLLITLDDGYLDNYVYAWPILQKYGHKGVIFAVAESLNAATANTREPRPTLADVWEGRITPQDLPGVDDVIKESPSGCRVRRDLFFTWEEARRMEASGVIAIGGHSLAHSAVFAGPEFSGFSRPTDSLIAFHHEVAGDFWGRPRFRVASAFTGRAFYPSEDLLDAIRHLVPQEETAAAAFFDDEHNVHILENLVASFDKPGRHESDTEQKERLYGAMQANQAMLRQGLGHEVRSFCWPWGHSSALALAAGQAAGFSVFYNVEPGPNRPGRPLGIRRMNYRADERRMLARLRLYARPLLGELYKRCRI